MKSSNWATECDVITRPRRHLRPHLASTSSASCPLHFVPSRIFVAAHLGVVLHSMSAPSGIKVPPALTSAFASAQSNSEDVRALVFIIEGGEQECMCKREHNLTLRDVQGA